MTDEFELRIGPGGVHEIVEASANGGAQPAAHAALITKPSDLTSGAAVTWQETDFDTDAYVAGAATVTVSYLETSAHTRWHPVATCTFTVTT